jgi:hypothetical protein
VQDLDLGQVVHEFPDGVRLPTFGDLVQQDVFGIELPPGVQAVNVGQYAVYYDTRPWCYRRRSGQLTWSWRWEGWWEGWKWSEQTWLWLWLWLVSGLEVVSDGMEGWDVSAREVSELAEGALSHKVGRRPAENTAVSD